MFTFVMFTATFVVVLLATFFGWFFQRRSASLRKLQRRGMSAEARVVAMNSHLSGTMAANSSSRMEAFFPVVRFNTQEGVVEAEVLVGAKPAPAKVGQQVRVHYDPDNPRAVLLAQGGMASPGALGCFGWALSIGLAGMAVVCLLFWFVLKVLLNFPG
ncbi:DUF3592 domain-containing protein [Paenarthrobacter sp. NPDC089675]|uniref:DUF3592 domain-containing protein n=1 Tax=Paenarthrobacter sp. NPDC089675 TaxID=3364376 RepID=UPI0037F51F67